ncbi:MAG TPA: hypothetical protein VF815_44615, partial [Myxococcaceae bacterium]
MRNLPRVVVTPLPVLMWAFLAPVFASQAHAETATFAPVADATVDGSKHARSMNDGTAPTLELDKSPTHRSFQRFAVAL